MKEWKYVTIEELDIKNEAIKNVILSAMSKLERYPMVMKDMDVENQRFRENF